MPSPRLFDMSRNLALAFLVFFVPGLSSLSAQVTTRLVSSDTSLKLGGVYLGSTVYTADVFSLFETNGIRRYAWQPNGTLTDVVTNTPGCGPNPQANTNPECGDQIDLFWKHISCQPWYVPCASNDRWNGYPGQNNLSTYPTPTTWPPVSNFNRRINYQNLNAALDAAYPNGLPTGSSSCHPENPGSRPTGTSAPKVVYHPGFGKYFMAFNANIGRSVNGQLGATDNWRVVWAISTDGANWTIYPGYLFRSVWEQSDCSGGFQVLDLLIDNGYFYLLVESPDTLLGQPLRPTSNQLYLLRSLIGTGTYGFTSWFLASTPLINGESGHSRTSRPTAIR